MPLLSIIVPVYNTELYLRECLDSIMKQDNGKIEVIIVDDGSTDSSGQICDEYAEKHAEIIRVIHQENQGLLLARRRGIKESTGDYIAHLDSDDYYVNGAVSTICEALEKNECDMLLFDYIYGESQDKDERVIKLRSERNSQFVDKREVIDQFLWGNNIYTLWIKITKRSLVDLEKDYSEVSFVANGEDILQSLPLLDRCESFVYIPKPLYYYRRDNISMSKSYCEKDYYSFKAVYTTMMQYAEKWIVSDSLHFELCRKILYKNISILVSEYKSGKKSTFNKLLTTMSRDSYFHESKDALKCKDTSNYYRLLYVLISHRLLFMSKVVIALMN